MLALSPPIFSTFGWPLEETISQEIIDKYYHNYNNDTFPHHLPSPNLSQAEPATPSSHNHPSMAKKLNHNASERDRRKKINDLYSSLRSLLPAADQLRRLSIPATVSRVLKYIPELQGQVERLIEKKEELSSRIITKQQGPEEQQKEQQNGTVQTSSSTVSATKLGDGEIVVQISTLWKAHKGLSLSEVLLELEEDGFNLINASSFESLGERVFFNLHLQDLRPVDGTRKRGCEELSQKLLSLFEKWR